MTPNQWQALQRSNAIQTVWELSRLWRSKEGATDFGAVWDGTEAAEIVSRAQLRAAEPASEYVADQVGRAAQTDGAVQPAAFAGVASDGRPLDSLLRLPSVTTIRAFRKGVNKRDAYALGRRRLGWLGATQTLDAGRVATSVAQTVEPEIIGYRRKLRGSTNCARCIVIAGRLYRWHEGFARHPKCDCVHEPVTERDPDADFTPERTFEAMSKAEQDATFGEAGAQAIRDGADLGQVVNARRGMRTTTAYGRKFKTTTQGTTVRSLIGKEAAIRGDVRKFAGERVRRSTTYRLMPEQIYKDAKDRADAARLLKLHGYVNTPFRPSSFVA